MIRSSNVRAFELSPDLQSDIFIHALGFERRSSAILGSPFSSSTKQTISLLFANEDRLSFRRNLAIAQQRHSVLIDDYTSFFRNAFNNTIRLMKERVGRPVRLTVDISSMNRTMIATALFAIFSLRQD